MKRNEFGKQEHSLEKEEPKMSSRIAGVSLIAAASLCLVQWVLVPSPGITDAQIILDLVARQRGAMAVSVIVQLISAVFYVLALAGVIGHSSSRLRTVVWWPASVFLIGLLGDVADAIIHLLAYAMTAPGLDQGPLLVVMRFMQGPALLLIAPLILSFFIGSAWLSAVMARECVVSKWNPRLYAIALGIGVLAALLARVGGASPRMLGLVTLGSVSAAQIWVGVALWKLAGRQIGDRNTVTLARDLS